MKKIYLLFLVLVTMFAGCKEDREVEFTTFEIVDEKFTSSYTSVDLNCKVRCAATIKKLYLQYDTVTDFSTYQEVELVENEKTEVYSVKIDDLLDNTTYYVRYVAVNSYSQVMSEEVSEFKTLQATVPTIEVREITDVLDTIATVGFVLKFNGGADVTKMGVCWSMDSVPTIDSEHVECCSDVVNSVSDGDLLFLNISGLEENTTYYVRAYAENKMGIVYSEGKSFITLTLPVVKTNDITEIQYTSAVLHGEAIFDGNDPATIYGFCWSEENMPTIEGESIELKKDFFSYRLLNLKDETQYYVRAYAKNKIGVGYGEEKVFKTKIAEVPIVETLEAIKITYTTAIVGGKVISDGGVEVTDRGVCFATVKNPTISDLVYNSGKGIGEFSVSLKDLITGETYYVRAYAKNSKGISYGKEISFVAEGASYVDLGLSVKWATCNVGATTPEEYGDYFAWGEVEPKTTYNWSTYKYGTDEDQLTKYCNNSDYGKDGFTDNKTILDPEDDAATVNWGDGWRMPTVGEQIELQENCKWTWITQNGVNGHKVVGPNGNSIFLPAAGGMLGGTLYDAGSYGLYWSSSLTTDYPYYAYLVEFGSDGKEWGYGSGRYYGFSVRPVYGESSQQPEIKRYTVSVYSHDNSRGTVSGGGTYAEGSQVTITATANSGYKFKEWNDGNTDNPRVITVMKDAIYTAHFEADVKQYRISVYSHDNSRGTVSGGGTYAEGSQVTITATANSGYKFKEWNDGNTDNPRVITVTKDAIYTAHFEVEKNLNAGHEYVDLGLSVKWATCNVGATTPEEYGDYFAWGEVEPKTTYNWSTYKYCKGTLETLTKYCYDSDYGKNGFTDNKTVLDPEDDAATANWGGEWRMPTKAEQDELLNNCTWTWTTQKGVKGYKVVGPNGNSIFLPAAGYMFEGTLYNAGSYGHYWSSSLYTVIPGYAYYVHFYSVYVDWDGSNRYYGLTVRPVCL